MALPRLESSTPHIYQLRRRSQLSAPLPSVIRSDPGWYKRALAIPAHRCRAFIPLNLHIARWKEDIARFHVR